MAFVSSTQTIRDDIATRLNEVETDNSDRYTGYVNLCLRDIFREFPDSSILHTSADRTLSSGTRIYSLPSDYDKFNNITYPAGNNVIRYLEPEQFDMVYPSAQNGTPEHYTVRGNAVSSYVEYEPQPNADITVHYDYQKVIPTVSTGSATPQIPEKYYSLICDYGEAMGLKRRGEREDAASIMAQYESDKQKMIADLRARTTETQHMKQIRDFQAARVDTNPIVNIFNGV